MQETNKKIKDGMTCVGRVVKRSFDFIGALVGLILTSPAILVIYILQKTESRGSVFFKQERVGKGGKPFFIYKFRTMKIDAEEDGPQLAAENDKRLTCVGKVLRAHHLDELPQLWNVLKGEMSFVGYRPERQFFIDMICEKRPDYIELYQCQPGVTSRATLYNGYTDTIEKMITRLDMDLDYIRSRSVWMDIKIIAETLWSVIAGKKF